MARRYAEGTTTEVATSLAEIKRSLARFKVSSYAQMERRDPQGRTEHSVVFEAYGQRVRLSVIEPKAHDPSIMYDPAGRWRNDAQQRAALERETMRRWRVLAMLVKAKVVAITETAQAGMGEEEAFQAEFLPYALLPDGSTFAERARGRWHELARTLPPLLATPAVIALPERVG